MQKSRQRRRKLSWTLLLILSACAWTCSAQDHQARIVEVLPDDQFIVEIGGKEYRAINGNKAVELAKQKVDLQECRETEGQYKLLVELANKDVTIANQKAQIHETNFRHAMQMYTTERELRQEAQSQFIPHGKVGGFGGKFLNFLDSPYGQSLFKLVIPAATFIKTMRAN